MPTEVGLTSRTIHQIGTESVPIKSVSKHLFRPFRGFAHPATSPPRLAPWAAFFCRFAAISSLHFFADGWWYDTNFYENAAARPAVASL